MRLVSNVDKTLFLSYYVRISVFEYSLASWGGFLEGSKSNEVNTICTPYHNKIKTHLVYDRKKH